MDNSKQKEQVITRFTEYLTQNKHRKTPERFAILEYIYSLKGHFDIDSLYTLMNKDSMRVSRATLYNTVELLLSCGLIIKHQFGANISKYEKATGNENHDHLICLSCGEVKEYKSENIFTLAQQKRFQKFSISYYSMYIYGLCNKCTKKKLKEEKLKETKNKANTKK